MFFHIIKEIKWDKVTGVPSNNVHLKHTIIQIQRSELFRYHTADISGLSQADVT